MIPKPLIAEWGTLLEGFEVRTVLEPSDRKVGAWYLSRRGSRHGSVLVTLTPEGLVLSGDGHRGSGHATATVGPRYDLDWWLSELSPSYLAEKFLARAWHPEVARAALKDAAETALDPDWDADFREKVQAVLLVVANDADDAQLAGPRELENTVHFASFDTGVCEAALAVLGADELYEVGHGYDPDQAAWLVAVQRKFRAMWPARLPLATAAKARP